MSGLNQSMMSTGRKPTGMKGKVHDMASTLQKQNEELGIERGRMNTIKDESQASKGGMTGQLKDIERYFHADVQRMQEEFRVQLRLQEAENVHLQQQVTQLKGEKTSIHQQILALQRRIDEIGEEIGQD
mmetsp:Transcript_106994/g.300994  ORF Transcript_106994/g.300994 Transcript_106994/m.300994 type:complete len:129 (-) Transcript_106994:187-573(-)|eukprot:CAMPEP_0117494182 /NCGR_PEP_ID=MMETSP0784-20121206/19479_1 /TAXON_ID=39447 /ORGANISM="" /LENGTH=128 /DNA_ID=CAMNT_0005289053 /DNA_START=155 /DNA_END=541 /DNA_ORIENTATION=+